MSSLGRNPGAMVYGIVQYDFNAERPDELEAKAGEAIIVIAQSNPEWFVAKPIGRLGGPGLIPVSFIELRDMTSGQAVEDPLAAVQRAGVPKVEEWKKMAAEYKNSSISLGKFDSPSQQSMTSGVERMSLNNGQQYTNKTNSQYVCEPLAASIKNGWSLLLKPGTTADSKSGLQYSHWSGPKAVAVESSGTSIRFDSSLLLRQ